MKKIQEFETALANQKTVHTCGINYLLLKSYSNTQEAGNERIDISDIIWEHDYDTLLADMRKFGISEFTISSTFSGLLDAVDALMERGCTLEGLIKVKDRFPSWMDGERELHPALLLKVN